MRALTTEQLKLTGGYRADRHGHRAESQPIDSFPKMPDWLLPEAQEEWNRVRIGHAKGVIKIVDGTMLAVYCQLWARFAEAEQSVPYNTSGPVR
jgi:phage terminase small subunit